MTMIDNFNSPAEKRRFFIAPLAKAILAGHGRRWNPARTRRPDDITFIAIAALLAIFLVSQASWVIAHQSDNQPALSRQ